MTRSPDYDRMMRNLARGWNTWNTFNIYSHAVLPEPRRSPTNFYPMCGGGIPDKRVRRMLGEHLFNPEAFWGEWVLPSISRDDPAFGDQAYWRGPVWGPMNMIVYWGLLENADAEARAKFAEGSARTFLKEWHEHRHVHENYNAITGSGCSSPRSNRFYHWGALLALIPLIEVGHYGPSGCTGLIEPTPKDPA